MRRVAVMTVLVALALAACKPYDFDANGKADFVMIDADGNWYRHGNPTPFYTAPPGFDVRWSAPGDYDGDNVPEPTNVSEDGEWQTDGERGTFVFESPDDYAAYPVPADYDGDGATDAAWYDSSTATWYVEGELPVQYGLGNGASMEQWAGQDVGDLHDFPLPADYDGDGVDEIAVYRPTDGTVHVRGIGEIADLPLGFPATGDFDGDDVDEPVVYRDNYLTNDDGNAPQERHAVRWYLAGGEVVEMSNPELHAAVPRPISVPVPADYDGDGDDDLAASTVGGNTIVFADGRAPVDLPDGDFELPPTRVAAPFTSALRIEFYLLTLMQDTAGDLTRFGGSPSSAWLLAVTWDGRWYEDYATAPLFGPSGFLAWPVMGDYDGDGWWEPANAIGTTWSTDGERGTFTFTPPAGGAGAYVPADYDGDLVTDPAWYSEANATWYIEGEVPMQFGTSASAYPDDWAEVPVPADYDGDGEAELAFYRPTDGTVHAQGLGEIADLPLGFPAPADYDGDGVMEPAVYNTVEHRWHFADGSSSLVPGLAGSPNLAFPAPAAYRGLEEEPVVFENQTKTFHRVSGSPDVMATAEGFLWPMALPSGLGLSQLVRLTSLQQCAADPASC